MSARLLPDHPIDPGEPPENEYRCEDAGAGFVGRRDGRELDDLRCPTLARVLVAAARPSGRVRDGRRRILDQEGGEGGEGGHLVPGGSLAVETAARPVETARVAARVSRALVRGRLSRRPEHVPHLLPEEGGHLRRRRQPPVQKPLEGDAVERAGGLLALLLVGDAVGEEDLERPVYELVEAVSPYLVLSLARKKKAGIVSAQRPGVPDT